MRYILNIIKQLLNEITKTKGGPMTEKQKIEFTAVAVPKVAVTAARNEMNRRKENGVPMSLGAVIGEAIMDKYGKQA